MENQQLAFIGLGVMGYPMAGHLVKAGFKVTVYNRTASKSQKWQKEYKGQTANTPREAALGADFVFTCVGNDEDLCSVIQGEDGALAGMKPGSVLVDHTTASANVARELAESCEKANVAFLDAPVSGGQAGAENGQLTIMVGGATQTFETVRPVLDTYAKAVTLMGGIGSGQLCKMVNQICVAGLVQGLAEGLHFAQAAGLDAHKVIDVISKGAAQSWQMENRHQTMLAGEYNHGFAVDWMRKDLDIVLGEARQNGSHLPVTALVDQFYSQVQAMGGGRWDTSSLLALLTNSQLEKNEESNS